MDTLHRLSTAILSTVHASVTKCILYMATESSIERKPILFLFCFSLNCLALSEVSQEAVSKDGKLANMRKISMKLLEKWKHIYN